MLRSNPWDDPLQWDLDRLIEYVAANRGLQYINLPWGVYNFLWHKFQMKLSFGCDKKPTYGLQYGQVDRMLWECMRESLRKAPFQLFETEIRRRERY